MINFSDVNSRMLKITDLFLNDMLGIFNFFIDVNDPNLGKNLNKVVAPGSSSAQLAGQLEKGGIDLSFQPEFIERPSHSNDRSVHGVNVPNVHDNFKGFNFRIVRFTPELTANSAFQLMFNSNMR